MQQRAVFFFFLGGWDYVFSQHIDWELIPGGRGMPRPYRFPGSGGVLGCGVGGLWVWGTKKGEAESLSLLLRGRLPTLPLSQYHRRGEA